MTVMGCLFAGGAGRRLGGVEKALIEFSGSPLWKRATPRITPMVDQMVVTGPTAPEWSEAVPGLVFVQDFQPNGEPIGPAGGLLAALENCLREKGPESLLLTVPIDAPFFPVDLFAQLSTGHGNARAALVEKKKAVDMSEQLKAEIGVLDDSLRAYEEDIHKLQSRLREARSRQSQIAARLESAENRVKLRSLMTTERVDEALTRFDSLERRVDYAEGRADQLKMESESGKLSLSDEIAALEGSDKVDEELEEMKRALGKGTDDATKGN